MVSWLHNRARFPIGAVLSGLVFAGGLWAVAGTAVIETAEVSAGPPLASAAADLAEIRKRPVFYRGQGVQLTLQLGAENEAWNSYLTRFDTRRYQSWNAWADSQALWHYSNFIDSTSRIFAKRGGKAATLMSEARPYDRFLVTAKVRTIFMGEPWIEVLQVVPLELSLGRGSLLHASRARDFAADELYQAAVDQFKRALDAPLPSTMEIQMRAELSAAEAEVGEETRPVEEIAREG